ncbi:MAG: hypothetical protein AAF720_01965 [Pseudomonadota bacterium]
MTEETFTQPAPLSYRTRVQELRKASRERLAQLRKDRLARRRYARKSEGDRSTKTSPSVDQKSSSKEQTVSNTADAAIDAQSQQRQYAASPETLALLSGTETNTRTSEDTLNKKSDPVAIDDTCTKNLSDDTKNEATLSDTNNDTSDAQAVTQSLAELPSIAEGMVWHLNKVGIETLDDLADVNVAALREKLGGIGALAAIDDWVAFARERRLG